MEMTLENARQYPMVYAPDRAFKWVREGDFFKSVYRVICDWEDDTNTGNVLGWVHKLELEAYTSDDVVDTMVLVTVPESGVIAWVAGSDKLWCAPKYVDHIRITGRDYLDCSCNTCRMRMYEIDEAVSGVLTQAREHERIEDDEDIAIYEYVICEDCIRDLDDEVLEAISQSQRDVRKRELADAHNGLPVKVVMTDAELDAQLAMEDAIEACTEEIAREYVNYIDLDAKARTYARSQLDGELATSVDRQILEDVAALMCMSSLGQVDEVIERVMLFTHDMQGRADHMQVFLEEIGKVVDVRVTEFVT